MDWAMKDEAFKVQLFRFVDVLPCLKTDELVIRLFNEYFSDLENTPFMLRQGLGGYRGKALLPTRLQRLPGAVWKRFSHN